MTGREKEIVRHLSGDDLDRLLTQTDSEKVSKRLTFIKRVRSWVEDCWSVLTSRWKSQQARVTHIVINVTSE